MKLETTDQMPMGSISMVSLSLLTLLLPLFVAFVGIFLMVFIGFVQNNLELREDVASKVETSSQNHQDAVCSAQI